MRELTLTRDSVMSQAIGFAGDIMSINIKVLPTKEGPHKYT